MATAKVQILHCVLTTAGWVNPGPAEMDADEARALESRGMVDVLEVDGKPEVWQACCNGSHDHA